MLDSLIHETTASSTNLMPVRGQPRETKPKVADDGSHNYRMSTSERAVHETTSDAPHAALPTPWLLLWTV
jgi:hypothetical protein